MLRRKLLRHLWCLMINFMGFTRSKEKISIEKVDEVFLFILVPNTLYFRLYRLNNYIVLYPERLPSKIRHLDFPLGSYIKKCSTPVRSYISKMNFRDSASLQSIDSGKQAKNRVVFFAQIIVVYTIVNTSLVQISLRSPDKEFLVEFTQ